MILVKKLFDLITQRTYTSKHNEKEESALIQISKEKLMMKMINQKTKTFKVFNALYNGDKLTQAQASKRFGVGNLAAEAHRIRMNGYGVYSNRKTAGNGVKVTEYYMARPPREVVALGYAAKAQGLTVDALSSI